MAENESGYYDQIGRGRSQRSVVRTQTQEKISARFDSCGVYIFRVFSCYNAVAVLRVPLERKSERKRQERSAKGVYHTSY